MRRAQWYNGLVKAGEQIRGASPGRREPKKDPRRESDDEAFLRFVRGSWYWALLIYATGLAWYVKVVWPYSFDWLEVFKGTCMAIGSYVFYLMLRMKLEDRLPPGIYDQFDDD